MWRVLFLFLFMICIGGHAFAQTTAANVSDQDTTISEQYSQEIRADERKLDFATYGLQWLPWNSAGKSLQDFVTKREANAKNLIGSGRHVDAAIADLDQNGQPDIVLFFWGNCGNQGCLYKVYYDREVKKPDGFFGWDFIPYKKGVMLDHAYFSL